MAVRKIIRMGHPTLRQVSRELEAREIGCDEVHRLVADMIDTLHDYGGIGLAAPQINEPVRLAIIEIAGGQTRYGDVDSLPLTVFVNPSIEVVQTTTAGYWEGCLSVPVLRGFVERPQHVKVTSKNLRGEEQNHELEGFLATIFQHEFDHLDGKLYIDHITDSTKLVFDEEYERYVLPVEEARLMSRDCPPTNS
ncbi:MAG: peptide deformylase [Gammaproteobacteria bacterium]|nr:peptide deformylase [Gammaproteobacteria bacterium]